MKQILLLLILAGATAISATPIEYAAPEFLQCYYDQYSYNYLNAAAVGRGHTGVGVTGDIQTAFFNPAAYKPVKPHTYIEVFFKPGIAELDEIEETENNYLQSTPFGIIGAGFAPVRGNNFGFFYAIPRCIKYYQYSRRTKSDRTIIRYPAFTEHQLTFTFNRSIIERLTAGANFSAHIYHQTDYRKYYSWDRVNTTDALFRIQPGLLWEAENWSVGISYKSPMRHDFDMTLGETYNVTIPDEFSAGLAMRFAPVAVFVDVEYIRCSKQSDAFDNKLRWKIGIEKQENRIVWRLGYIENPGVFSGEYAYPQDSGLNQNDPYNPPNDYGVVGNTDQGLVTCGFSWLLGIVDVHVGFLTDVKSNYDMTQAYMGLSLDLRTFDKFLRKIRGRDESEDGIIIID
ncbi:MAG: hypothetical protein K8S56_00800 [Candidatus Cloacimonetes bacterium]|nr:hypothetical protein [Candidatus Cloacimonadota bacterium]